MATMNYFRVFSQVISLKSLKHVSRNVLCDVYCISGSIRSTFIFANEDIYYFDHVSTSRALYSPTPSNMEDSFW